MQHTAEYDLGWLNATHVFLFEESTVELDARTTCIALSGELDGDRVGVETEVLPKAVEVTQSVSGTAADIQNDGVVARADTLVKRRHIEAADRQRAHVIVDERVAEQALIEVHVRSPLT